LAKSKRQHVGVRELAPHPLLLLDRTTSSRALVDLAFAAEDLPLQLAMEMSSVEVLKRLAELGFGVAIVPRFAVQREREGETLRVFRLEQFGVPRSVGALTPRAFTPTRAALAFLSLARDHSRPRRSSSSSLSE
jgi:DNA-binding transcriptional LysR family regulator